MLFITVGLYFLIYMCILSIYNLLYMPVGRRKIEERVTLSYFSNYLFFFAVLLPATKATATMTIRAAVMANSIQIGTAGAGSRALG